MYTPPSFNATGYGEDTDVVKYNEEDEAEGRREMMIWGLVYAFCTLFIFFIATFQYFKKRASTPKAKKLRRLKEEEKKRTDEEKKIMRMDKQPPVHTNDLVDVVYKKKKKGYMDVEFKALNHFQTDHPCDYAKLEENISKNYTTESLPFDHNRVVLSKQKSDPYSDYINASYVDAFGKKNVYIAAQGPSRRMVAQFWRMVWEEGVHCIVMATNVFEHARQQCEKYWHNQHGRYGGIDVWLDHCDNMSEFSVRTFRLNRVGSQEERIVKHYQFASWSDYECPNPNSVLEYRRKIHTFADNHDGPLLVHCGGSGGRTGAFIALDALIGHLSKSESIDIFAFILHLRNTRPNLVSTVEQYQFVYDALCMYIQCGDTVIAAGDLPTAVHQLAMRDPHARMTGFEKEFKTLQTVVPKLTVGECAGGHRSENRRKSRDIMLQPPERARPYLMTHDSNDSTDYINACYVDGYRHPNAYIVTQWPLQTTLNDIWRLVYDYNIRTIVVLNDVQFSKSYPRFWPSKVNTDTTFGPLTVEMLSQQDEKHTCIRKLRVRKPKVDDKALEDLVKETHEKFSDFKADFNTLVSLQTLGTQVEDAVKTVKMFQLKSWPNHQKVPTSASSIIELVTQVESWHMESKRIGPICIVSKDGATRVGFYCAISMAWEKLKAEGEVDIFRACKIIKANRPSLVSNLDEYILLYGTVFMMLDALRVQGLSIGHMGQ